jgi:hypothetical protein
MKRQVMQPFRAPRKGKAQSSPVRQSPRRQVLCDSEEDTALGLVYPPRIILETQFSDIEELSVDGNPDEHVLIAARTARSPAASLKPSAISSTGTSPNLSEFEAFMDRASADSAVRTKKVKKATGTTRANSKNNVLQRENQRLASEAVGELVPVDFMLLDEHHTHNDAPIVSAQSTSLSLLVDVATKQVSSPQLRKKKANKVHHRCHLTLSLTLSLPLFLTL